MIKTLINNSSYLQRKIILIFLDAIIFFVSFCFSFIIMFSFAQINELLGRYYWFLIIYMFTQILLLNLFDVYAFLWRYNTLRGIYKIFKAVVIGHVVVVVI